MNYLIINGSPRHGHTWEIVTRVKNTLSTTDTNTTFTHVTLEGEAMVPEDSKEWKIRATFGTLKAAKDWLNKKVGITAEAA